MKNKVGLLYSGGMDSTVLLYKLLDEGSDVLPVQFNYGQRHSKELEYGDQILAGLGIVGFKIDLSAIKSIFSSSCLTNNLHEVPEGHYTDKVMEVTVVLNRNLIMLSLASAYCSSIEINELYFAAHAGDHFIYPDCRPDFFESASKTIGLSLGNFKITAPFINITKSEIAVLGKKLNVPFEKTWSCYKGGTIQCDKCGTCVERLEALAAAGIL